MTREEYFASPCRPTKIKMCKETARVDFLFHIGPDLVPPYKDGDRLMIQKQPDVFEGAIGLFLIDGKPHVKKRGKDCLISLNPSIEPVPMSDNVQGLGKVLGVVDPEWIGK